MSRRIDSRIWQNLVADHGFVVFVVRFELGQASRVVHSSCATSVTGNSLPVDYVVDGHP